MDREAIGPYRIVRLLGKGGMGMVFEALHQTIGRRAAIKILHSNLARDAEYAQRFLNEAVAVNSIDHPSIVEIYDLGTLPDGTTYLVMEFLEGETLTQRLISRGGKLSPLETAWIGKEVAIAVAAAHSKGIIHRDLKPDNVMLARDLELVRGERVKLLDFGIAKLTAATSDAAAQTQVGAVMGTLWYISPEQLRNTSQVSDRADVFSLGALLYHLLAGRPPIRAGSEYELIAHYITHQSIEPIAQAAPWTPPLLGALVMQMLQAEPSERPAMWEVANALSQLEDELGTATELDQPVPMTMVARSGGPVRLPSGPPNSLSGLPPPSASTISGAASESALSARPIPPPARWRVLALGSAVLLPALLVVLWALLHRPSQQSAAVVTVPTEAPVTLLPSVPTTMLSAVPDQVEPPPTKPKLVVEPVVSPPLPRPKPKSLGCEKVSVTRRCIGPTTSPTVFEGVLEAAKTAELRICRGKTLKLLRSSQRMQFAIAGAVSIEQERIFSQTLSGFLIKHGTDLPIEVELRCGD